MNEEVLSAGMRYDESVSFGSAEGLDDPRFDWVLEGSGGSVGETVKFR